jgi:hypothetical protein
MADTLHTHVSEVELLKSFPWLVALDFAKLRNSCLKNNRHLVLTRHQNRSNQILKGLGG